MRENLGAESLRTSARFDSLDRQTQHILTSMIESSEHLKGNASWCFREGFHALTIMISQLLGHLEDKNKNEHLRTRDIVLERLCEYQSFRLMKSQIISEIEMLNVSDSSELKLRYSVQEAILRSLKYGMKVF